MLIAAVKLKNYRVPWTPDKSYKYRQQVFVSQVATKYQLFGRLLFGVVLET